MFCNCACISWIDLSSLAMRDFSSSTESFSDCTWPETVSTLPLTASILRVQLLLQGVHGRGHLVGVVGGLLRQVLQHAKARVHRGLQALHHVQQLLHLGLQLDDLLRNRVGRYGGRSQHARPARRPGRAIAKCACFHASPTL